MKVFVHFNYSCINRVTKRCSNFPAVRNVSFLERALRLQRMECMA